MMHPAMASAIPTLIPVAMRGIRTFQIIVLLDASPPPNKARNISDIGNPAEPTEIAAKATTNKMPASEIKTIHFLPV
jgi:hypothetical protein